MPSEPSAHAAPNPSPAACIRTHASRRRPTTTGGQTSPVVRDADAIGEDLAGRGPRRSGRQQRGLGGKADGARRAPRRVAGPNPVGRAAERPVHRRDQSRRAAPRPAARPARHHRPRRKRPADHLDGRRPPLAVDDRRQRHRAVPRQPRRRRGLGRPGAGAATYPTSTSAACRSTCSSIPAPSAASTRRSTRPPMPTTPRATSSACAPRRAATGTSPLGSTTRTRRTSPTPIATASPPSAPASFRAPAPASRSTCGRCARARCAWRWPAAARW